MKKTTTRQLDATQNPDLDAALATIEDVFGAHEGITKDDKAGGKLSSKEYENLRFALGHIKKYENFLRRDFNEADVYALLDGFDTNQKQLEKLNPIVSHLENDQTVKRVALKAYISEIYKAAGEAGDKNSAFKFVYEKMKVAYARTSANTDETTGDKATAKVSKKAKETNASAN